MDTFVDLKSLSEDILIDAKYATKDNFMGEILYPIPLVLVRKKVGEKLVNIHNRLKVNGLGLKVFDCYRPLQVQKKMWEKIQDDRYVAPPDIGSKHNRGAAVDLTLVDAVGNELVMPSDFDDLSKRAHRNWEGLPKKVVENCVYLEEVMQEEGFIPLPTEWWHFDDAEWEKYPIVDICLETWMEKNA